jgi:hypothetical protein
VEVIDMGLDARIRAAALFREQEQQKQRDLQQQWDSNYAQIQQDIDNMRADSEFFPLSLSADREIPTGRQLVIDTLTIESTSTLTIAGRLHNLFDETTDGTVVIDGTWIIG